MKYIKLYDNRREFVFDEQRFFPNTSLVNGEEEPSYFTDVEEVVFELTVTLPTEKVVTGETYTLAVEYGGADVFSEATVTTTGDVTLNGTQFTANTDGDFSVTATYDGKTVTLNGTSKLMTAAPTISEGEVVACGRHLIDIVGNGTKKGTFDGVDYTYEGSNTCRKALNEGDTARDAVVTATAQEEGKWESDVVTATFSIPQAQTFTATISDDTLEDGQTAQITMMYGSDDVTISSSTVGVARGDVSYYNGVVTAHYSTGSGSVEFWSDNPNLPHITINVTVTEAVPKNIVFADPDVKNILVNKFGSDGEITDKQAAAVTTWFEGGYNNTSTNPFCKNANVDSFDEFAYFTGVSEIGEDAFQECSNMQSITLPSSLTYLPDYTFSGCSSLESINIPDSVTYIGYRAFYNCSSLESVTIGAGVESWGTSVFSGCAYLTYMSVNANNSYFNDGNGSNVVIDNSGNLLYGGGACSAIPNTAYTIGQNAFSGIHLLNNTITIPSSVTSIGASAFYNCDDLTSITIPNSVTSIGKSAFKGCDGLASVTIGNSVASIGSAAFQNCSALTSVTIPASVTTIDNDAFNGCTSLGVIIFEGDVPTRLGARAFTNTNECPIYVPAAYVSNWGAYTERIQAIENIVFADNDVKSILANAFGINGEITNAQAAAVTTFMSGTNSSTNPFYGNTNVNSFDEFATYFTSVTALGNSTFNMCSNMTSITIPASVTSIGGSVFEGCSSLTSLTIPASVTSIGQYAFFGCTSLTTLTMEGTTPPTLASGSDGILANVTIYVPASAVDTYKAASGWSTFASNIQAIGGGGDEPEYTTVVLDFSQLENEDPFTSYSEGGISVTFDGCKLYNGYLRIPNGGRIADIMIDNLVDPPFDGCISYIKMTHTTDNYKLNADTTYGEGIFTCTVDYDSTNHVTTFSNFVSADQESPFDGNGFALVNQGTTQIRITRIEICYVPASE